MSRDKQNTTSSLSHVPSAIGALIFHFLDIADVGIMSASSQRVRQFAMLSLDLPRTVRCLHRITSTSGEPSSSEDGVSRCRILRILSTCSRVFQVCEAQDEFQIARSAAQVRSSLEVPRYYDAPLCTQEGAHMADIPAGARSQLVSLCVSNVKFAADHMPTFSKLRKLTIMSEHAVHTVYLSTISDACPVLEELWLNSEDFVCFSADALKKVGARDYFFVFDTPIDVSDSYDADQQAKRRAPVTLFPNLRSFGHTGSVSKRRVSEVMMLFRCLPPSLKSLTFSRPWPHHVVDEIIANFRTLESISMVLSPQDSATLLQSLPTLTSLSFDKVHKPFNVPLLSHVKYHPTLVILDAFKEFHPHSLPNITEARIGARSLHTGGAKDLHTLDRLPNLRRLQLCRVGGNQRLPEQPLPFKFPAQLMDLELSSIKFDDSLILAVEGLQSLQRLTMMHVLPTALTQNAHHTRLARALARTPVKILRLPEAGKADIFLTLELLSQGHELALLEFCMSLFAAREVPGGIFKIVETCESDATHCLIAGSSKKRQVRSYVVSVKFSSAKNQEETRAPLLWSG